MMIIMLNLFILINYQCNLLSYISGATTALRSWPASGVSEAAHGLAPHTGPIILLSIFLSNAAKRVSSDLDSVHVSKAYVSTGTI